MDIDIITKNKYSTNSEPPNTPKKESNSEATSVMGQREST